MAIGDPYITLPELKGYLNNIPLSETKYDDLLNGAIESASAEVEQHCNRQFNKTTTPSSRTFTPTTFTFANVADFHTASGLVVEVDWSDDGSYETWSTLDYRLYPDDGVVGGQPGWPFWKIRAHRVRFPYRGRIRVTAQWGWSAVPAPVKQATLIMAAATYKAKDAPFGVAGFDGFGSVRVRDNPMAAAKLRRYVLDPILVG